MSDKKSDTKSLYLALNASNSVIVKKIIKITTRYDKRSNGNRLRFIDEVIRQSGFSPSPSYVTRLVFQVLASNDKLFNILMNEIIEIVKYDHE